MPQSQQEGTGGPKTNVSVPQQDEQTDITRGKDKAYYNLDVDCKSEGSDPEIETFNENEENSDTKYAKMELH